MKKFLAFSMSCVMFVSMASMSFAANDAPQATTSDVTSNNLDDGVMPIYDYKHEVDISKANTYYLVCSDTNLRGENVYAGISLRGQDFIGNPDFKFKLTDKKGKLINEVTSYWGRDKTVGTVTMLKGWKLYVKTIPTEEQLKEDENYGTGTVSVHVYDDE